MEKKTKLDNIIRMLLFPAALAVIQIVFLMMAVFEGRGILYLIVSIPVWFCVVFLYFLAIWLTRHVQEKKFSRAALLIVIFSGILMMIGSLTQVILIGHLTCESNASKYILYEIYEYAKGEEGTRTLHTSSGDIQDGTIDTFISEETASEIIAILREQGLTFTHSVKSLISEENPLREGEEADEKGYVYRQEEITANYHIMASEAKKAREVLKESELFPAYQNILEEETWIRELNAAKNLMFNYLQALLAGLVFTLFLLFMHGHYYDYWIGWLVLIEIAVFAALLIFGTGSDGASINLGPLQPLEFLKLIYIFVLTDLLCKPEKADCCFAVHFPGRSGRKLVFNRYIAAAAFIVLNALGYMACGELGTLLIIGCMGLCMFMIFCEDRLYRIGMLGCTAGAFGLLGVMGYFRITYLGEKLYNRFHYFFSPGESPEQYGHQYIQLKQSLAVSGWFGTSERYRFHISQEENDMVFAALVQARGIVYGILVIFLFIGLLMVSYRAALRASDVYYRGLGLACCLLLGFQGLIHISYNVGAFPITGVPLMYISDGGSNIAVSQVMTILLLVISSNHLQRAVSDEEEVDRLTGKGAGKLIGVLKRSFSAGWIR
ncbi:MAG: FtsW/RodA/SpoVE family cell cycle protein [Lachnospiraceae bacterium]|nr:FtsW/RodA/SpoVE family cell cycle protein [Lachnospiraceae bacterium]